MLFVYFVSFLISWIAFRYWDIDVTLIQKTDIPSNFYYFYFCTFLYEKQNKMSKYIQSEENTT